MVAFETDEKVRLKRLKIEQAVNMAMQSRWPEAAELNRQLVDEYPKEVEAHNRLGRALLELGRFEEAREAYNHALRLEPMNTIAQKNVQRLDTLMAEAAAVPVVPTTGPVDPALFIAETGRSVVTMLVEPAAPEVLATVDAGDPVELRVEDNTALVLSVKGDPLGKVEPRLRQRLIRLTKMGNQYGAVVTGVDEQSVRIIIRETHRDPSMGDRPSFPTTGETFRGYTRESLVRYDLEDEEEEEEEEEEAALLGSGHEPEHELEARRISPEALIEDEAPVMPVDVEEDEDR